VPAASSGLARRKKVARENRESEQRGAGLLKYELRRNDRKGRFRRLGTNADKTKPDRGTAGETDVAQLIAPDRRKVPVEGGKRGGGGGVRTDSSPRRSEWTSAGT